MRAPWAGGFDLQLKELIALIIQFSCLAISPIGSNDERHLRREAGNGRFVVEHHRQIAHTLVVESEILGERLSDEHL